MHPADWHTAPPVHHTASLLSANAPAAPSPAHGDGSTAAHTAKNIKRCPTALLILYSPFVQTLMKPSSSSSFTSRCQNNGMESVPYRHHVLSWRILYVFVDNSLASSANSHILFCLFCVFCGFIFCLILRILWTHLLSCFVPFVD